MSDTPRIEPVDAGLILENEQNNYMRLAHASKRIETELAKALDEIKGLRQLVNDCHVIAGQLETERNEARAEIERLNAPVLNAPLLRETLAELAHNQWAGWMAYLFFKSKQVDGCVVIPAWANERWRRQVATRYSDLSEAEKDSDRDEADKFLAVFNAQLAERDKLIVQMREALHLADGLIDEYTADYEHRDNVDEIREEIKAALAAERLEE